MILTGKEIEKRLNTDIKITPYDPKLLNPNSYNLRLHNELAVYKPMKEIKAMRLPTEYKVELNMKKYNPIEALTISENGLLLEPGKLYLGRTVEFTETYNLVPMIEGRSSIGRLGMYVHVTAGFGDVGFKGFWTLEIHVIHPLMVYPGVPICQIFYHTIEGEITEYNSGKYQNNSGLQPSLLYKEFE